MATQWKVRLTYKLLKEGKSNTEINKAIADRCKELDKLVKEKS